MLPLCGTCNRPVQRMYKRIDFWSGLLLYVVECHGQREVQAVPCPHDAQELMVF